MTIRYIKPREPNMDPQTKEEQMENLSLFQEQMIRQEMQRNIDLCEIIYSLMDNNGPSKLTAIQRETVQNIKSYVENKLCVSTD